MLDHDRSQPVCLVVDKSVVHHQAQAARIALANMDGLVAVLRMTESGATDVVCKMNIATNTFLPRSVAFSKSSDDILVFSLLNGAMYDMPTAVLLHTEQAQEAIRYGRKQYLESR